MGYARLEVMTVTKHAKNHAH